MLDTVMLISDARNSVLEAPWECFRLCFKAVPAMLKLTMTSVIQVLPIVVNDQVCNIDLVLS